MFLSIYLPHFQFYGICLNCHLFIKIILFCHFWLLNPNVATDGKYLITKIICDNFCQNFYILFFSSYCLLQARIFLNPLCLSIFIFYCVYVCVSVCSFECFRRFFFLSLFYGQFVLVNYSQSASIEKVDCSFLTDIQSWRDARCMIWPILTTCSQLAILTLF